MKKLLKSVNRWLASRNSAAFTSYLRKQGCKIGNDCRFYSIKDIFIDLTRPYLIELRDNVILTKGVIILTHGFEWAVLREKYGMPFGNCAKVLIKSNCFIGMNTIVLEGVTIGENVIVGAGSVVSGNVPDNVVVAGNPAKVIMSLSELKNKYENRQLEGAIRQALEIKKSCGRYPIETDFEKSYFSLFLDRNGPFNNQIRNQIGRHEDIFRKSKPMFSSFSNFFDFCFNAPNNLKKDFNLRKYDKNNSIK